MVCERPVFLNSQVPVNPNLSNCIIYEVRKLFFKVSTVMALISWLKHDWWVLCNPLQCLGQVILTISSDLSCWMRFYYITIKYSSLTFLISSLSCYRRDDQWNFSVLTCRPWELILKESVWQPRFSTASYLRLGDAHDEFMVLGSTLRQRPSPKVNMILFG